MEVDEKSATILAVDDTPENLDIVKGILVDDYNIRVAAHGKVALKIAETQSPDLILLDIMMPEMDGYEVCRLLKANPVTRDIPVIFLTAKGETADEAEGFKLGAADYILKPVNPPLLKARVKTHLALKQNMDELQVAYTVINKQKERMQTELNVGRDIQMSMVPDTFPAFPEHKEFDIHALLQPATVNPESGRPGMDSWKILVMGSLRLNLNCDYDRLLELVNNHKTIRQMLGHGFTDDDLSYHLQTLKDNVQLFTCPYQKLNP